MSTLKKQAEKWIADSGDDTEELQLAAQIMRDLLTTVEHAEQFNSKAQAEIKRLKIALSPAYVEPAENGRDLVMTGPVRDHVLALRSALQQAYGVIGAIQFSPAIAAEMFVIYKKIGIALGKIESV